MEQSSTASMVLNLVLTFGLLALMFFLLIRPQQVQARKRQQMLDSLKQGMDVVTIGGLHGTITALDDKTVRLRVAPGVELTFSRSAIGSIREEAK